MSDAPASPEFSDASPTPPLMLAAIRDYAVAMLDPRGQVLSWDGDAEDITGYGAADILGQPVAQLYTPEDAALGKPARDLEATLQKGRFEDSAYRVRKDGARFRALISLAPMRDGNGRLMGFVQVLRDVSRRIEAKEQLQAREAQHRSLVDTLVATVSDAVLTVTESGAIQSVNAAFEKLFARNADTVIGKNIKTLIAPDFHDHIDRHLRDVHVGGPAARAARAVAGLRDDGSHFPIEIAFGQATVGGEATFVGVIRDVSETARLRAQLVQARKGEAVGDLAGGIAHDFNNLLTVVLGGAEDLVASLESRPDLKRHADSVRSAAERAAELTQRLLAYSRQNTATPARVDCNQVLRAMRQLLRRTLREDVELRFSLSEEVDAVLVDAVQFETGVIGAVRRAQNAMSAGGRLTVSTSGATEDETFAAAHPNVDARQFVAIVFTDNGAAKPGDEGLEAARSLVEASNGFLDTAHPGSGNVVRLYLPAAEAAKAAAAPAVSAAAAARSGLVLVAEDDPFVRSYAVACLESLGYRVIAAVDGRDALGHLDKGLNPDILFTDIVMPGGVNGWQLAEQALVQRPRLKVLYTSGYALETLAEDGTLPAAARVLNKPYRRAELGRHMQELMGEVAAATG